MKDVSAYISIGVVCVLVLLLGFFKNKMELLFRILIRGVLACVTIYLGNFLFQFFGIDCFVGLNVVTLLTCIFLGFPGVVALFFISFF